MKEQDPNYPNIVQQLTNNLRVIHCRNNLQWIVQMRDYHGSRWRNISFHRERSSLIRQVNSMGVDAAPLDSLPERYRSHSKAGCASISPQDDPNYLKAFSRTPANNFTAVE
jgi:hypothetical protein